MIAAAVIALILTIVIGYVVGQLLAFSAIVSFASDADRTGAVLISLAVLVWLLTVGLALWRVVQLVQAIGAS